jgi:hypothetical protein
MNDLQNEILPTTPTTPIQSILHVGSYKEFIHCYLKQIQVLDGIYITDIKKQESLQLYIDNVSSLNSSLHQLDMAYQKEITSLLTLQNVSNSLVYYTTVCTICISKYVCLETRCLSIFI